MIKFLFSLLLLFLAGIFFLAILFFSFIQKVRRFLSGDKQAQSEKSAHFNYKTTHYDTGETVIDTRNQRQTERKIFTKDEGEYIDYEEEK